MAGIGRTFRGIWSAYESMLNKNPLRTQIMTSTALWGLGDVISQQLEERKTYSLNQTAYAATFGGALLGPIGHLWYQKLDAVAAKLAARSSATFVLTKVAADELLFGPLHVLGFFTFMTKAEGGSWQDVKQKLRNDFVSAYLAELAIWPAFQAFNFWKVPVRHQLLVVNAVCLVDATFLCWVKNQEDWLATLGFRPPSTHNDKSTLVTAVHNISKEKQ